MSRERKNSCFHAILSEEEKILFWMINDDSLSLKVFLYKVSADFMNDSVNDYTIQIEPLRFFDIIKQGKNHHFLPQAEDKDSLCV